MAKSNVYLTEIIQIGIVTGDADKLDGILSSALGWQYWGRWETSPGDGRYYKGKAEDFACQMSFYAFKNIELEVIQPLKGHSCWQDYLDRTSGIHHLLFNTDSENNCRAFLEANGWSILQQGRARPYGEKVIWAYADTDKDLKFTVEYTNRREYPVKEQPARPTVEGKFASIVGIRVLTDDLEKTREAYIQKLGWKETEENVYAFGSLKLYLTEISEGFCYKKWMKEPGYGIASLVIAAEDAAKARIELESLGFEDLNGQGVFYLGCGFAVEITQG